MDEGGTWHRGRHWSSPHCARWGHSSPPQKGAEPPPIFGPSLLWPNGWMHQDATWYGGKPQPRDFVLDGTQPPSPKGAEPHPILGHVYCGETAAWIIMPFGTEAGLGLRDIVFDVDPAIPRKKGTPIPTQFLAHVNCGQMAGWMKMPLGTEVDLGPGHIVLGGVPARAKGAQQPPSFRPVSCGHGSPPQLLLSFCLIVFFFDSVWQSKLAVRQLLGANKYSSSHSYLSLITPFQCLRFIL